MGVWERLFGPSSNRTREDVGTAAQSGAIPVKQQPVYCDCCNQPASFETGTYYTANEFPMLLQKGLAPHPSLLVLAQLGGITKDAFLSALPGQISLTYSSGWLLCPVCARQASALLAKSAGNLPGGEPDARARERTFRDAGTGKLFMLARAMCTKAMTGGSVSTVQADHYIISVLPPAPDPASRDLLISRLLASAGYRKGTAEVFFSVSNGGASGLAVFTDTLVMNYERSGKSVDLKRSQLHDFGGNGVPQGKLVAIYHAG